MKKQVSQEELQLITVIAKLNCSVLDVTGDKCWRSGEGLLSVCTRESGHRGPHVDGFFLASKILTPSQCVWYD